MESEEVLVIQAMKLGHWHEAKKLWQEKLFHNEPMTAEDYSASARVYERLSEWNNHKQIVQIGLEKFPNDKALQQRLAFCHALDLLDQKKFDEAVPRFENLFNNPVECCWPIAVNYFRWESRLQKRLAGVKDNKERLLIIEDAALYKGNGVRLYRISGIVQAVECMNWPEELEKAFIAAVKPLIVAFSSYQDTIEKIIDAELAHNVGDLALFWRKNISFIRLPLGYYELFSRVFVSYGYIDLYTELREKFIEEIAGVAHSSKELAFAYQLTLANEEQDSKKFLELVSTSQKTTWIASENHHIQRCLASSILYYPDLNIIDPSKEEDNEFYEYIKGKSVAIVGPVDVGLESGDEIDNFDIVIRFNHSRQIKYDRKKFGSKTDVCWYAGPLLVQGATENIISTMSQLEYAITCYDMWTRCGWQEQIPCKTRDLQFYWGSLANPFIFGYPNGVQRALFDILRFSPARVKVFSSDLYTSMHYHGKYAEYLRTHTLDSSLEEKGGKDIAFFSVHDPISNFIFTQRLFELGRIEADAVLTDVLSLNTREYMDRVHTYHVGKH